MYKSYCSLPRLVLPAICKQGDSCCYHVSVCCHLYSWWWPFWLKWAMRWNLEVVLVCVALMVKEAEHFSKCFIGTCFYFEKFLYLFYVYVYAYVYAHICVCLCICLLILCPCLCTCICLYICLLILCMFMYMFMHIYMFMDVYAYLFYVYVFPAYIFVYQVCA